MMDNLAAHKVDGVRELIEATGAELRDLPPYSPDFNPIEPCWSVVKQHLRQLRTRSLAALDQAIPLALALVSPAIALNCLPIPAMPFVKSRIGLVDRSCEFLPASRFLRIHQLIGPLKKCKRLFAFEVFGNSDTGGNGDAEGSPAAVDNELPKGSPLDSGHFSGGAIFVGVFQNQDEFVPAPAANRITIGNGSAELSREQLKDLIALLMTVGVIHLFEPIQVEDHDAQRDPRVNRVPDRVFRHPAISQSSQRIRLGELLENRESFFHPPELAFHRKSLRLRFFLDPFRHGADFLNPGDEFLPDLIEALEA